MSNYLSGTKLRVGCGVSTVHADMDFETYSEAGFVFDIDKMKWRGVAAGSNGRGLFAVGAPVYAEHPSTEVLYLSYNLKDGGGPKRWRPGLPAPLDLFQFIAQGGIIEAHNSGFEYLIWMHVCHKRMGWPPLPLDQLRCSMSKARAHSMPGALGNLGPALGLSDEHLKDAEGSRIMKKLCIPRNPTKTNPSLRWTPETSPEDYVKLYAYGDQDIVTESAASARLPDLIPAELDLWLLDQRINQRGVSIDVSALEDCISVVNAATDRYTTELVNITGGTITSASEVSKILGWLGANGMHMDTLDKDTVAGKLKKIKWAKDPQSIPDDVHPVDIQIAGELSRLPKLYTVERVLQIRASLGSAGVKKLFTMSRTTSRDGRLRELFAFCGADRTGRFSGRGAQPQNLVNSGPQIRQCDPTSGCGHYYGTCAKWCPFCGSPEWASEEMDWRAEAIDDFLAIIATRDLDAVERFCGDAVAAVSGCLRGLFVAAEGHDLICSDYSAIEGVVAAVLAGEQWRVDVFNSHGKIYEMGASKISGVPFEEMMSHAGYNDTSTPGWWLDKQTGEHHPLRKKIGKISELASGFGGWIGAWKNFGADKFMDDDEIKEAILAWRAASPNIVEMWGGQHRKNPDRWEFTPELFGLEGAVVQAILYPGQCFGYRGITYGVVDDVLYCKLLSGRFLTYHEPRLDPITARNGMPEYQISYMGTDSLTKKWIRLTTYSGKLFENVVQATARDILGHAMVNLEAAGYPLVLHVHDEPVSEVPTGTGSVEEYESIMVQLPAWAEGWPIKAAGGWRGKRYRKD